MTMFRLSTRWVALNNPATLSAKLRFALAYDVMERDVWCYSGDSGIMTAAYLHLSAATASIREPL